MATPLNWQIQNKRVGTQCYVPVRQMSSDYVWGSIGGTQVTHKGVCPPRAVFFPRSKRKRSPTQNLMKLSTLKRSLGGVGLVDLTAAMGKKVKTSSDTQDQLRAEAKSNFYSKLKVYADLNVELWGPTIVVGPDHSHYSVLEQQRDDEKNGRYRALGPIPDAFMLNDFGFYVPWVAPYRMAGKWVVHISRFFIGGDMGENEDQISDQTIINRVGHYVFQ